MPALTGAAIGRVRDERFGAGDVGDVPQGVGHDVENAGADDLELLIVLNNGAKESISLTDWIAANPAGLLASNFAVPESVFAGFPKGERTTP